MKVDELNPMQKRDLKKVLLKHMKALQAEMDAVKKGLKALEEQRSFKRTSVRKAKR